MLQTQQHIHKMICALYVYYNYLELFTHNFSCIHSKLSLNNMNHHQDKRGSQLDIIIDQVLTCEAPHGHMLSE